MASQQVSKRRMAFMAFVVVVAPLVALQLSLLGGVGIGMNDSVGTDLLLPTRMTNQVNSSVQRYIATASREIFSLKKNLKVSSSKNNQELPTTKTITSPPTLFEKMPTSQKHTFYIPCGKSCHPMIRALRVLDWTRVNTLQEAQMIFTYNFDDEYPSQLSSWQRYNHLVSEDEWYKFVDTIYSNNNTTTTVERYWLDTSETRKLLETRLLKQGGHSQEWILHQAKEITSLQPNSDALKQIVKKNRDERTYIRNTLCNEMTWNGHLFDVRVLWLVASTEPLIVYYMNGWARIGEFREEPSTRPIEMQLWEKPFPDLEKLITQEYKGSTIKNPMAHVVNQMKQTIGEVAHEFGSLKLQDSFPDTKALDGYSFFAADFVFDTDLNVYLTNLENQVNLGEDYYFRLELNHDIYFGMASILQDVWEKQEAGKALLPIDNCGKWQLVYADDWKYTYQGFKPVTKATTC